MQQACEETTGGMAAIIGEEREKVADLCREFDIEAANFNAPGQIVVSGEKAKVEAAVAGGKARGMKRVIPLVVAGAYHSRLMEPARAAFAAFLEHQPFAVHGLELDMAIDRQHAPALGGLLKPAAPIAVALQRLFQHLE